MNTELQSLSAFLIEAEHRGIRLDKILTQLPSTEGFSRERLKKLIKDGGVILENNPQVKLTPSYKVKEGDVIVFNIPENKPLDVLAEDIPLDILYEDSDVIVINKPAGISVHPSSSEQGGTLVNALLFHCKDLSGIGGVERPGIVHRLDKGTSGVMIVAKNDKAHTHLAKQFSERTIERFYLALSYGVPIAKPREIETYIARHPKDRKRMAVVDEGGKHAITTYEISERFGHTAALLRFKLHTGRTHQIRVHAQYLGHPLLGDPVYGGRIRALGSTELHEAVSALTHQMLHAEVLGFEHPRTGETMRFTSPLPKDMAHIYDLLKQSEK